MAVFTVKYLEDQWIFADRISGGKEVKTIAVQLIALPGGGLL